MLWLFVILALILLWAIPAFRTLQEMEGQPAPRWRIPTIHHDPLGIGAEPCG
jgi:hypothetical protein